MLSATHAETILGELEALRQRVGGRPAPETIAAVLELEAHRDAVAQNGDDPSTLTSEGIVRPDFAPAGAAIVDATNAVLMDTVDVSAIELVRDGDPKGKALAMTLGGRVNKRTDRARLTFLFGGDGAAGIITELIALAHRIDPLMADRLVVRVREALGRTPEVQG